MSNLIQIKRSLNTAVPASLANGELAFTANGDVLYIGSNGAVVPIGGKRVPGTLTANQALVANSTSGIDKIITGNAVITTLWANGSGGSNGQVLVTNGTAVYWGTGTSGANTYVQFNDSGVANGVSGFTYDKVTSTLAISNAISTQYITAGNGSRIITTNYNSVSGAAGVATDLTVGASGVGGNVSVPVGATISVGTTTLNSTFFSATANNANYLSGNTVGDLHTYSDNKAANAYSNAVSYTDAAILTANAAITGNAATAYSNAAAYADTKAAAAYSNAMADTLSRNGSYTGNNSFAGTNTVISSNLTVSGAAVYINGNITLGDATSDTINPVARYANNVVPSANVTYDLGTAGLRWNTVYANTVNAISGNFAGNVTIGGDLTVSGNLTTTNVSSVVVSDPMIYLAGNNYTSDLLDIGFAANYYDGSQRHTGLFRDHTDGLWKLFYNLTQELEANNDVDTTDPSYRTATLVAYLNSGGLVTNTTAATITANSSFAVNIVANTLSLSTALPGTSGGTGLNSYTAEDILVANSSNGFRKLGLGTSGYVLQSNGSALVYDVLDGGSF
jgi:hypothetical protein